MPTTDLTELGISDLDILDNLCDGEMSFLRDEFNCIVSACGSRVTCYPAPYQADFDFLCFLPDPNNMERLFSRLSSMGFTSEGEDYEMEGEEEAFKSWRDKNNVNLIVTSSYKFYENHLNATALCTSLNLLSKADRVILFEAILYKKFPR